MASIMTQIGIMDRMTAPLQSILGAVNGVISAMENVDAATDRGFDTSAVLAARQAYDMANVELEEINASLQKAAERQDNLNKKISQGTLSMDGLAGSVLGLVGAYAGMQGIKALLDVSDEMSNINARLEFIVDDNGSVDALRDKIFSLSQETRSSFLENADIVAKLGSQAAKAFASNDDLLAFVDQLNKTLVVAGASSEGASSAIYQLTQAMGAGKLQGEELNSLLDNAPALVQNIQKYFNEVKGIPPNVTDNIKKMASEGMITANVIKSALAYSADEVNEKFSKMPLTWAQVWTSIVNRVIYLSQPLLNLISMIAQNWASIEPVILTVAGAVGVYTAAVVAYNVVQGISNTLQAIGTAQSALKAGATLAEAAATTTATGAQAGLNAAMLASPVTWIVIAIIAIVSALIWFSSVMYKAEGTASSTLGAIAGFFMLLYANIMNQFIVPTWNIVAAFINFFGNAWNDPIASVQVLFFDLAQTVIGYIISMAQSIEDVINKIPGVEVSITAGLKGFQDQIEKASQQVKDKSGWVEYAKKMDYKDLGEAYNEGYKWGAEKQSQISSYFNPKGLDIGSVFDTSTIEGIGEDTKDIKNSVSATAEELKFLRDLAETEAINRYTTAEIKVEMGGVVNNVSQNTDLDGVVAYLEEKLEETIAVVAEGVHE